MPLRAPLQFVFRLVIVYLTVIGVNHAVIGGSARTGRTAHIGAGGTGSAGIGLIYLTEDLHGNLGQVIGRSLDHLVIGALQRFLYGLGLLLDGGLILSGDLIAQILYGLFGLVHDLVGARTTELQVGSHILLCLRAQFVNMRNQFVIGCYL